MCSSPDGYGSISSTYALSASSAAAGSAGFGRHEGAGLVPDLLPLALDCLGVVCVHFRSLDMKKPLDARGRGKLARRSPRSLPRLRKEQAHWARSVAAAARAVSRGYSTGMSARPAVGRRRARSPRCRSVFRTRESTHQYASLRTPFARSADPVRRTAPASATSGRRSGCSRLRGRRAVGVLALDIGVAARAVGEAEEVARSSSTGRRRTRSGGPSGRRSCC